VPYGAFEYVDVTFGTANTDQIVEHTLETVYPEDVNYELVKADRATAIYNDQSASRRPWGRGYIILRSSVANAQVRLLLTTEAH
jgi:hypothetical protein